MASARRRARDARDACLQSRRGAASVASGAGMALSGMLVAAPLANAASWTVAEAPRGGPMAVSASGYCFEARRGLRRLRRGHGPFGVLVAAPLANAASWTVAEAPLVDRFVSKSARDYETAWR